MEALFFPFPQRILKTTTTTTTTTTSINSSFTPQFASKMKTFLHFLLFFMTVELIHICVTVTAIPVHSQCIEDEKLSLLRLKKSLVFDSYASTKLITWNSSIECCSWVGVTCSTNGRVVGLDISQEYISGGIDNSSSSLFDLQHLESLNLSRNGALGYGSPIPSAIGKLTNLRYLNLSGTGYSGQIPISLSRLTRLVILDLSQYVYGPENQLKVKNPNLRMLVQNLTELTELYLHNVRISASSDWCQSISSSFPNLRVLSLSACYLSGPIDHSLANLQFLSVIRLDDNNISAPVPGALAKLSNLTSLSLRSCGLRGTFPKQIFQVPTLQTIDLSDNLALDGSFPEFLENGGHLLQSLVLSRTNFSGFLPHSIHNLKLLSTIDLSGSSFTGSIPKSIENLTQLVYLDLSWNKFDGLIDSIHWENLINLVYLKLNQNLLGGSIPSSIFSPPLLEELLLSTNQFSGRLHEFVNVSPNLATLNLSVNNLEGPVPVSIFNCQGLEELYLSSNNFSGFPFNGPQQLMNLSAIDLSHNSLLSFYNGTNSLYSSFPQITVLKFASNKLRSFPDFFRNHTYLGYLDLSENQIEGEIPNWIWSLITLSHLNLSSNSLVTLELPLPNYSAVSLLDLHSNKLEGQIPLLPFVRYLDYSQNNFSSIIPTHIGDFLYSTRFLSLSSNNLLGPIPVSICNASLELLDLSNNSLSGMIPQCLTEMSRLSVLNLRRNNLTGTIYDTSREYCGLRVLDLGTNRIQGQIPKFLANCTRLEFLNLGNNQMMDTFPCFLKNISTLRVLVLRSNKFYGSVECSNANGTWPILQIIQLSHNNFSGAIPGRSLTTWHAMIANKHDSLSKANVVGFSNDLGRAVVDFYYDAAIIVNIKGSEMELVKILTIFTEIDFSSNNFNGMLPKEIGELTALYVLNLSSNAFTGEIPSSFANMRKLESLDLSQNKLRGQIPPEFAKLTFLSFLNLSDNQLVGKIPSSTQFSTFPKASFEGNKGLWGPPLTADNNASFSPPPPPLNGSNPNSGDEDDIDWDLISVEIGFTVGFGIAIGSLVFFQRWRKCYYRAMFKILLKIFPRLDQRLRR